MADEGRALVEHLDHVFEVVGDLSDRLLGEDLGMRLGLFDLDLALLSRSMAAPGLNPGYGVVLADRMLAAYPTDVDPWRLDFYRLLDELF